MTKTGHRLFSEEDIANCVCGNPRYREDSHGGALERFICENCGYGVFSWSDDTTAAFRAEIAKQHGQA